MKARIQKSATFIGKSMLWSLLLYVAMMLLFNWDDVNRVVRNGSGATIVHTLSPGNDSAYTRTNTSVQSRLSRSVIAIFKAVSGFSASVAE